MGKNNTNLEGRLTLLRKCLGHFLPWNNLKPKTMDNAL